MSRDYRAEYRRRIDRGRAAGLSTQAAAGHGRGRTDQPADRLEPTTSSYADFLQRKQANAPDDGVSIDPSDLHPSLFPHQREAVRWAAERGRAGVFLDTGLGKTRIQVSWLDAMTTFDTQGLIICPLSIAQQTIAEASELGIEVRYARSEAEVGFNGGLWITNYEMQRHFEPDNWTAVVLDESSILKNHTGPTRTALIERWGTVPYRLACTATPAPNDHTELANHAEFLGAMRRVDMLAAYFVHDSLTGWRLKGHAADPMFRWMSTWALAARKPSDITGNPHDDEPYELPPLRIHAEVVEHHGDAPDGQLFATGLGGVQGRAKVRQDTLRDRVSRALDIIERSHPEPVIAWCGLNDEATGIAGTLPYAENLHGALPPERKVEIIEAFKAGEIRVLVTKPSIAGMGLNFQNAARQVFIGLGDSYESYYQAIRRSWRFGQDRPVDVHIVVSDLEAEIVANVRRKEASADQMTERLVRALHHSREEAA